MRCAVAQLLFVSNAAAYRLTSAADLASSPGYGYAEYLTEFGKVYNPAERTRRSGVFAANLAAIRAHNANPAATWRAGLNRFTDWDAGEFRARLGLRRRLLRPRTAAAAGGAGTAAELPVSVDWRKKGVLTAVKDQQMCGSCWAFSTTETLESALAIATGTLVELSEQQLVSCSTNPKECGGTGGCQGSTQPIGFEYIKTNGGIATEGDYPYTSGSGDSGACNNDSAASPTVAIDGYVELPTNNYTALISAVASEGPIAISVAAEPWQSYESGVFTCNVTGCAEIDHAVQLVGYGDGPDGKYWIVRNSWDATWGESGFIRVRRYGEGSEPCATDDKPGDGFDCKGGPASIQVCGDSGILSASSYPTGARLLHKPNPTPPPTQPPCGCGNGNCYKLCQSLGSHCTCGYGDDCVCGDWSGQCKGTDKNPKCNPSNTSEAL